MDITAVRYIYYFCTIVLESLQMKYKALYICLSAWLCTLMAEAQEIVRYADSVPGIEANGVSVYIENLRDGEVVLDVNGETPMIPASVTKLFTAATLFQNADLNAAYSTCVLIDGKIDRNGSLDGNLIICSDGDPTLESACFPDKKGFTDSISVALRRLGVNEIRGKILVRSPEWLSEAAPDGWTDNDLTWAYGSEYKPFNYADNRLSLKYSRNGDYTITPATDGVRVKKSGKPLPERILRDRNTPVYRVYYKGRKPFYETISNPLPENTFRAALRKRLEADSIALLDKKIKSRHSADTLLVHRSAPIYDIAKSMIMRSDNKFAEPLLRYAYPGLSRREALSREADLWTGRGISIDGNIIEDGSGLSRNNRISAYALADLLVWMIDNDPNFIQFSDMLPVAGQSGTMRGFLKGTPLEGRVRAKTGSLNGVQCYAGYVTDAVGVPTHVVVIMVNGFKISRAELKKRLQNLLIEKLS